MIKPFLVARPCFRANRDLEIAGKNPWNVLDYHGLMLLSKREKRI
jgi:hypothetical protein